MSGFIGLNAGTIKVVDWDNGEPVDPPTPPEFVLVSITKTGVLRSLTGTIEQITDRDAVINRFSGGGTVSEWQCSLYWLGTPPAGLPVWTSSNTAVATVDAQGYVWYVSSGSSTIMGTIGGQSKSITVNMSISGSAVNDELVDYVAGSTSKSALDEVDQRINSNRDKILNTGAWTNLYSAPTILINTPTRIKATFTGGICRLISSTFPVTAGDRVRIRYSGPATSYCFLDNNDDQTIGDTYQNPTAGGFNDFTITAVATQANAHIQFAFFGEGLDITDFSVTVVGRKAVTTDRHPFYLLQDHAGSNYWRNPNCWCSGETTIGQPNLCPSFGAMNTNLGSYLWNATIVDPVGNLGAWQLNLNSAPWDMFWSVTGLSVGKKYRFSALIKRGTSANFCVTLNRTWDWAANGKEWKSSELSTTEWTRIEVDNIVSDSGAINIHLGGWDNYAPAHVPWYSQQQTGTIFMLDPKFEEVRPPLDVTCFSPWNSAGGQYLAGVALSPRHVLTAAHYALPTGAIVRFITMDNQIVERTIISSLVNPLYVPYYPDHCVGLLDSDLPASIKFATFLDTDFATKIPALSFYRTLPALCLDQEEKAIETDLYANSTMCNFVAPFGVNWQKRTPFYETKVSGDSSNPSFLVIDNSLTALCAWTFGGAGAGTSITGQKSALNTMMSSLGTSYQLTPTDLSGKTTY